MIVIYTDGGGVPVRAVLRMALRVDRILWDQLTLW